MSDFVLSEQPPARVSRLPWGATAAQDEAYAHLLARLQSDALIVEPVTLASGAEAEYYIDAKRALGNPTVFAALGVLIAAAAHHFDARAVGGLTMGADPVAYSSLTASSDLTAFSVRKERKDHGLQRWIEGPVISSEDRCLVVDDVVTRGGSVVDAINRMWSENLQVAAVVTVVDRLAGGRARIEKAANVPFVALTTVDDVFPERPDR